MKAKDINILKVFVLFGRIVNNKMGVLLEKLSFFKKFFFSCMWCVCGMYTCLQEHMYMCVGVCLQLCTCLCSQGLALIWRLFLDGSFTLFLRQGLSAKPRVPILTRLAHSGYSLSLPSGFIMHPGMDGVWATTITLYLSRFWGPELQSSYLCGHYFNC